MGSPNLNIVRKCCVVWMLLIIFGSATPYEDMFQTPNNRPIIGVLSQEYRRSNNVTYIAASYVKFLEGAGARVVPILANGGKQYLSKMFSKINGLLYPGGAISFKKTIGKNGYVDAGLFLYNLTKNANRKGDFFPIWGTCLGFELMMFSETFFTSGKDLRRPCEAWNKAEPLKFTSESFKGSLLSSAPKSVIKMMKNHPIAVNFHHYCIPTQSFSKYSDMKNKFWITSQNYDKSNQMVYVSSVQSKKFPIYGVQFHPEKNIYEWGVKDATSHSFPAILTSQYFANFFVNQARKNKHRFGSKKEEDEHLIYNFPTQFSGKNRSHYEEIYLFENQSF